MIKAVIAALVLSATSAQAAGLCEPLAGAKERNTKGGRTWTAVSTNEWEFLRGIYAMNPLTPVGLPFGSGAALVREAGNDGAVVVFIDGDVACTPMIIPKALIDILATVAAGTVNHEGSGL